MKKFLLLFVLASACTAQSYAQSFTVNGISYAIISGTNVRVAPGTPAYSGAITIPATVAYAGTTYNVYEIPNWSTAIAYNSGITSVNINAKHIGNYAMQLCPNLISVTFGDNVESIGVSALRGCSKLTSITISKSVSTIGNAAFIENSSLTTFNVDANNPVFTSDNGVLFDKNKTAIFSYPAGKPENSYTIPNTVEYILGAFGGALNLTSVTIPNSVRTIAGESFKSCTNLAEIYCHATTPPALLGIGDVFAGVNVSACKLYVPANSVNAYKAAAYWKDFLIESTGNDIETNLHSDPVVSARYYTLSGNEVAQPQQGNIYIVKELRQSGKTTVGKVVSNVNQ